MVQYITQYLSVIGGWYRVRDVVKMKMFHTTTRQIPTPFGHNWPSYVSADWVLSSPQRFGNKKNINKLKTCKYTNKWKSERKYEMTKGACAVLSSSPRSQMVYTIRSVSALVPAQWPQETVTLHATYPGSTGHFSKYLIRVKYPVRKPQYPNTNSPDWSTYISLKNWLREFVCTSKLFTSADHFINSYQIFSKLCTDNVKRKLTLVSQSWDLKG